MAQYTEIATSCGKIKGTFEETFSTPYECLHLNFISLGCEYKVYINNSTDYILFAERTLPQDFKIDNVLITHLKIETIYYAEYQYILYR